jgi:murein DD-endopeptidase MepM/ murein hydrolase activator NlpD
LRRGGVGLAACAGLLLLLLAACGSPSGPPPEPPAAVRKNSGKLPSQEAARPAARSTVHVVARGETLYRISKRYGSSVEAIMSANAISDVHSVPVGARLVVPSGGVGAARRASVDAGTYASRDPRGRSSGPASFAWPLHGVVISEYGLRRGAHHDGLDIKAPSGTIVRAAESGRVIHADASLSGYGKLIIVKHAGRLSSVYAHNRKMLVRVGQFVEKGDAIAELGQTGNASVPHLHFEIRSDGSPRDPLEYLQ